VALGRYTVSVGSFHIPWVTSGITKITRYVTCSPEGGFWLHTPLNLGQFRCCITLVPKKRSTNSVNNLGIQELGNWNSLK
jgi:hypothetical protein